jgi:uncharacterized protein
MLQKTLEARTTIGTDRGEFAAIAAAYSVDRVGDEIQPGAFARTIARWQASGKKIPLHWDHQGEAHNVIGAVNPASMRETNEGLYVEGKLDLEESATAREAWRSMRNDAVSLSFAYIATAAQKRADGVNELREIDLFEISVVPAPANPDTRFLSLKAVETARATNDDALRAKYQAFVERMGSERVAREILGLSERVSRQMLRLPAIKASDGEVKSCAGRELRFAAFDVGRPG